MFKKKLLNIIKRNNMIKELWNFCEVNTKSLLSVRTIPASFGLLHVNVLERLTSKNQKIRVFIAASCKRHKK